LVFGMIQEVISTLSTGPDFGEYYIQSNSGLDNGERFGNKEPSPSGFGYKKRRLHEINTCSYNEISS